MGKKVVISGYYGCDNFGDESILTTLVEKLKTLDVKEITVISHNPKKTAENLKVKSIKTFGFAQIIKSILCSDILISGGGSLLQDATSVKSLFYYLLVIFIAQFFNKKVFIFAQGIGPINNKLGEILCKKALKKATCVTVRDDKSLFLLRGWGINVNQVNDPLFGMKLHGTNSQNKVGIQLRQFKTVTEDFLIKLAQVVERNFYGKQIEIYSLQDSLDEKLCIHFEAILKSLNPNLQTKVIYNKTPKEIIEKFSELDFMIAMRFHACLIAAKYGVRTLALSYDYKVDRLAELLKLPCLQINNHNLKMDFFVNQMKNLDRRSLLEIVNSKIFDWSYLENLINQK